MGHLRERLHAPRRRRYDLAPNWRAGQKGRPQDRARRHLGRGAGLPRARPRRVRSPTGARGAPRRPGARPLDLDGRGGLGGELGAQRDANCARGRRGDGRCTRAGDRSLRRERRLPESVRRSGREPPLGRPRRRTDGGSPRRADRGRGRVELRGRARVSEPALGPLLGARSKRRGGSSHESPPAR